MVLIQSYRHGNSIRTLYLKGHWPIRGLAVRTSAGKNSLGDLCAFTKARWTCIHLFPVSRERWNKDAFRLRVGTNKSWFWMFGDFSHLVRSPLQLFWFTVSLETRVNALWRFFTLCCMWWPSSSVLWVSLRACQVVHVKSVLVKLSRNHFLSLYELSKPQVCKRFYSTIMYLIMLS